MKDAMGILLGLVLTVVALVMTVTDTFVPYKENQAVLSSSNSALMSSLQAEVDSSTDTNVTVTGASIKTLINNSVGSSNIVIIVGDTTWDHKSYSSSNISVSDSTKYTRTISTSGSVTTYTFN